MPDRLLFLSNGRLICREIWTLKSSLSNVPEEKWDERWTLSSFCKIYENNDILEITYSLRFSIHV